jgi:zona occludens toxin (predicted ATPase)
MKSECTAHQEIKESALGYETKRQPSSYRRIFDAAGEREAMLFFDEVDALFGKRTEVKDRSYGTGTNALPMSKRRLSYVNRIFTLNRARMGP